MFDGAAKKVDGTIPFTHQHVSEAVRESQNANRSDRVGKQRVRSVERMDEPRTVGGGCPACCLHRTGHLDGELIKFEFTRVVWKPPFQHQSSQIAIGRKVVESMVMYAPMG